MAFFIFRGEGEIRVIGDIGVICIIGVLEVASTNFYTTYNTYNSYKNHLFLPRKSPQNASRRAEIKIYFLRKKSR